jgi:glycopeptide antibiotics resistance protein
MEIKMIIDRKALLKTAFALYGVLMIWLLFGQRVEWFEAGNYFEQIKQNISLVPFATIRIFIRNLSESENTDVIRHAIINLAGNVVMFVPLGFFIPAVSEKFRAFWRTLAVSFLCIVTVEILQLFLLLGSCDTDDLILNIIGVTVGYLIFKIIWGEKK